MITDPHHATAPAKGIVLATAAIVLAYLGVIGYFSYDRWQTKAETKQLLARVENAGPNAACQLFLARWDELSQAVEFRHSPVEIFYQIHRCVPPNTGLRFRSVEISADEITLIGESPQVPAVNQLGLALGRSKDLANFQWQTPAPNQSTRGWEFTFKATPPKIGKP